MDLSGEKLKERIGHGILEPVDLLIQHALGGAAALLILAGIDAMAHVNRRGSVDQHDANDFEDWVATYFDVGRKANITPEEWWAARCVMLHAFGVRSQQMKS